MQQQNKQKKGIPISGPECPTATHTLRCSWPLYDLCAHFMITSLCFPKGSNKMTEKRHCLYVQAAPTQIYTDGFPTIGWEVLSRKRRVVLSYATKCLLLSFTAAVQQTTANSNGFVMTLNTAPPASMENATASLTDAVKITNCHVIVSKYKTETCINVIEFLKI